MIGRQGSEVTGPQIPGMCARQFGDFVVLEGTGMILRPIIVLDHVRSVDVSPTGAVRQIYQETTSWQNADMYAVP